MPTPSTARFVWLDRTGSGRNLYAMFRKSVDITGTVKNAAIHIFADTFYKLYVNGTFVEYGPIRFDPRFPQFDTHDIRAHLKPGRNVIAVLVNHFGMKTFKAMPAAAG